MSEENVEAFRRGITAYNRGDVEAMLGSTPGAWPLMQSASRWGTTVYRGYRGVREFLEDIDEAFTRASGRAVESGTSASGSSRSVTSADMAGRVALRDRNPSCLVG